MRRTKQLIVGFAVAGILASGGSVALAHNAAHIHLPTGECQDVGSGKSAPFVPDQNPHQHQGDPDDPNNGRLDLQPGDGDQYGARYGADQGNSRTYPNTCADANHAKE